MNWRCVWVFAAVLFLAMVYQAPAPLVYTPGEGWTYEPPGKQVKWRRETALAQLQVAEQAFQKGDYGTALKAAKRILRVWPLSDYAPNAQFLIAQCYEAKRHDERAFKEYQKLIDRYPRCPLRETALQRQMQIANRFLAGQRFKLFGLIPTFPSMSRTADLFQTIVTNAIFSDIGIQAQLKAAEAYEKRKEYDVAAQLYELAADRYNTRSETAAEAMYKAAICHTKLARKSEYDQSSADRAISLLSDFIALYPNDPRVEQAQKLADELRIEQARGSFQIAIYYQKHNRTNAALIYYADAIKKAPHSDYAKEALKRIAQLQGKRQQTAQ